MQRGYEPPGKSVVLWICKCTRILQVLVPRLQLELGKKFNTGLKRLLFFQYLCLYVEFIMQVYILPHSNSSLDIFAIHISFLGAIFSGSLIKTNTD